MIRALFSLVLALGLSACGQITDRLGVKDPFGIPKPFEGMERNPALTARITESPSFLVGGIDGLEGESEDTLRRNLAAALQERDIVAATASPSAGAWLLRGSIKQSSARAPGGAKVASPAQKRAPNSRLKNGKLGPVLTAKPDLADQVGGQYVEWTVLDGNAATRTQFMTPMTPDVAILAAARLSAWVEAETKKADAAKPGDSPIELLPNGIGPVAVVQAPHAVISGVTGAPGDGDQTLARAMGLMLGNTGVKVTSADDELAWRIAGKVKVERVGAKDKVTLDWQVKDAKGAILGNLQQRNEVPANALAKNWGETAALAAAAAAPGLAEIIAKAHNAGLDPKDAQMGDAKDVGKSSPANSRKP